MINFKNLFIPLLCAAAFLFTSCGNSAPDRESAVYAQSAGLSFYDRFSSAENENMRYSKLALFSLTCDYDTKEIRFYNAGDEIKVVYKLTNMTDMELHTELQVLGGKSLSDIAYIVPSDAGTINPIATGYAEEKTFEPYETYSIPVTLTVPEDSGSYYICAGIGIQFLDEEVYKLMQINYGGISLDKMYIAGNK